MFTINIYLRIVLMAVTLIGSVVLMVQGFGVGYWIFPLLVGLILLVGYILLGTVQSAAQLILKMDFLGAEKRLRLTLNPNWLYVANRAYYYIMKGTIAQNFNRMDEAEEWLRKAQKLKLPTDNEKAAVELQLANLAATKNKWNQALLHFRTLKKLRVTEPAMKEQIREFEKILTNRGQLKAAGLLGMKGGAMMGKGKRRRPKRR